MKGNIRRAGILLLVLISFAPTRAGDELGISIYHSRGVFWAHRKTILQLEAPTRGIDVNLTFFTEKSRKSWHKHYNYPRCGLTLSYLDLGIPEVTGSAFGILPFVELRLVQKRSHELNFRWATGLGYLTKKWDLETNNQNRAVGSHFNANMRAHLIYHAVFASGPEFSLIAGITHYSNGNVRLPNLGVNCVEMGIGLGFNRRREKPGWTNTDTGETFKRALEIRFAGGTKETSIIYRKRIFPATLTGRYAFRGSSISRWHAGLDFFFDQGRLYRDNPADVTERPNLSNSLDIGVHIGHELLLGRLHFITEAGVYVFSPGLFKGLLYQRLGFKYAVTSHWNASVALKTHFSRADLFEWGIGYTLFR